MTYRYALVAAMALCAGVANAQNKLTPELAWQFGRVNDPKVSPDGKTVVYGVTYYDIKENKGNTDLYAISVVGGTAKKLTQSLKSDVAAVWRPDGRRIAYLNSESGSLQVWEMDPDGNNKRQLTDLRSDVTGVKYSPDMQSLIITMEVKMDKDIHDLYPDLDKADARISDGLMYRHWDDWEDGYYSHIFIAPYEAGGSVGPFKDIMANERFDAPTKPFGGMEQIAISPDGNMIAYTCKKENGTKAAISTNTDIYLFDINTSKTTNLSAANKGYDVNPVFSPTEKKIAYLSMATPGYEADKNRLIVYDLQTQSATELTAAIDQSVNDMSWSNDGKSIFFASETNATEQLYSVDVASSKIKQITKGQHNIFSVQAAGKDLIAVRTTMTSPTELVRVSTGGTVTQLSFTNKGFTDNIKWGRVEERWLNTVDTMKLQAWVIYPPDFDPNKKYPALVYCQGGPQGAISQSFSYRWNFQIMAAKGYIVIAPNRRGVTSFGQKWTDAIAGDWGGKAISDYLTAADTLAAMPFVDKNRLGAVGASYGGYSVYQLAGVHKKRFKVFIAHCGLFNMQSWYLSTEEMFFANHDMGGSYWKNPKNPSYSKWNPSFFVGRWDTPILVIHGQKDFRVPVEQGMQAFQAAQLRGIQSRFLYFPNEGHWIMKPQNSLLWNRVFFDWLDKYLKPGKA